MRIATREAACDRFSSTLRTKSKRRKTKKSILHRVEKHHTPKHEFSSGNVLPGYRATARVPRLGWYDHHRIARARGKDSKGTAAVTIYGEAGVSDIVLCNITPGDPDDIDSTRSELGGIYSGVVATELLVEQYGLTEGTVTVGCDSENALRAVFWDATEPTLEQAHFDLVSAIRCKLRRSPLKWVGRWIKGHQDDTPGQHLDWWARQNIAMDTLAKEYWAFTHGTRAQPRIERIEGEVWPLFCDGRNQNIPPIHTTFFRTKTKRSPLFLGPLRGFVNGPVLLECTPWTLYQGLPANCSLSVYCNYNYPSNL